MMPQISDDIQSKTNQMSRSPATSNTSSGHNVQNRAALLFRFALPQNSLEILPAKAHRVHRGVVRRARPSQLLIQATWSSFTSRFPCAAAAPVGAGPSSLPAASR